MNSIIRLFVHERLMNITELITLTRFLTPNSKIRLFVLERLINITKFITLTYNVNMMEIIVISS